MNPKTKEGVLRQGEIVLFFDEEKDAVLHLYSYHLYPGDHYTGDVERKQFSHKSMYFDKDERGKVPPTGMQNSIGH